jgi:glucose-1-phosphate cytidylyltransferase
LRGPLGFNRHGENILKAVILAGGLGTRLAEETQTRPKPMVEIGGKPIIWHIMKMYSTYGVNEFIVCLGYKGYLLKEYFANYYLHESDVTFDIASNTIEVHHRRSEQWRVTLVDTGSDTMTGGRLRRVANYIAGEAFCMTYGDGVADIDIKRLLDFHNAQNALATLTAVRPPGRFGALKLQACRVEAFQEKPVGDGGWINGGFFVLSPKVLEYIENDETVWEQEPLARLAREGQLSAYLHEGFWQPMDTLRDKRHLEELWDSGRAPWKSW